MATYIFFVLARAITYRWTTITFVLVESTNESYQIYCKNLIDGGILVETFVYTDKDAHIIFSTYYDYFNENG